MFETTVAAIISVEAIRDALYSIWTRPILLLTLCTLPLVLAAIFRRSYPNKPLVVLFAVSDHSVDVFDGQVGCTAFRYRD